MRQLITALTPGDPDDGQEGRQQRGMAIAATVNFKKVPAGYRVPSQSNGRDYYVVGRTWDGGLYCTCPDYELRQLPCKHIYAVELVVQRGRPDEGEVESVRRVTYGQNWRAYNVAQENEGEHFSNLLRELCDGVPQPPQQGPGRRRLPLGDVVYGIGLKVYSTLSTRRAMSSFRDAKAKGMLDSPPSFASTCRYLENPALYEVLKTLVEESALPLRVVEKSDFAVDSTGFSSSMHRSWYDHKWGKHKTEALWVKAHAMCGVTTNVVTGLVVTTNPSHDAPFLPELLTTTARHFDVQAVSGDKAYTSKANLRAIVEAGALPYLMFKSNTRADQGHHRKDSLWEQTVLAMMNNRDEWLARYHQRSNVESTFAMVKSKFGASVRSRTPVAQVNEVMAKFLCHNICVVIQAMYELGIDPGFGLEL